MNLVHLVVDFVGVGQVEDAQRTRHPSLHRQPSAASKLKWICPWRPWPLYFLLNTETHTHVCTHLFVFVSSHLTSMSLICFGFACLPACLFFCGFFFSPRICAVRCVHGCVCAACPPCSKTGAVAAAAPSMAAWRVGPLLLHCVPRLPAHASLHAKPHSESRCSQLVRLSMCVCVGQQTKAACLWSCVVLPKLRPPSCCSFRPGCCV